MKTLTKKLARKEKKVARLEKQALAAQAKSTKTYHQWVRQSAKLAVLRTAARNRRVLERVA